MKDKTYNIQNTLKSLEKYKGVAKNYKAIVYDSDVESI